MASHGWDEVFPRTTREQPPDAELRRRCASITFVDATRLDAVYRQEMETRSRARTEEAALLGDLIRGVRPALAALANPLLVLDVRAPGRPALVHLRAFLLFGAMPVTGRPPEGAEGLFLLDDATFVRLRFTGVSSLTDNGRRAFCADGLEGVELRGVIRDHSVAEVAEVLRTAVAAQTSRRSACIREAALYVRRLQSLRVLLGR